MGIYLAGHGLVPNLSGQTWFSAKIGFSAGSRSDFGGGLAGTCDWAPNLAPAQPPLAPTGGDALMCFGVGMSALCIKKNCVCSRAKGRIRHTYLN